MSDDVETKVSEMDDLTLVRWAVNSWLPPRIPTSTRDDGTSRLDAALVDEALERLAARLEATEAALREAQKRCKRAIDIYEDAGGIIAENEPLIVIERDLSRALAALDKEEQRKFRADTGLEDIPENVKLRHMTAVEAAALDKETPLEPGFSVEYGPMRGIGPEETQG